MAWILITLIAIGYLVGLYGFFRKAGEDGWKALVPGLRVLVWTRLTGKPSWWVVLSFIPIVNLFIYADLLGQTSDSMRRYAFWEHVAMIAFGWIWLPYTGFNQEDGYFGPQGEADGFKRPGKHWGREWVEALIFAIFAAYFIRSFLLELYTIPTSSMEGTLKVGDFLFVSKFHYGARVPNTPLAFPLVHHSFPKWMPVIGGRKAYLEWLDWDYQRLPAIHGVRRNDMVVFNFPANDTTTREFDSAIPYYDIIADYRMLGYSRKQARDFVWNGNPNPPAALLNGYSGRFHPRLVKQALTNGFTVLARPVDKRENYIKRCVALPGDTLRITGGELMIDGEPAYVPDHLQFEWVMTGISDALTDRTIESFDINEFRLVPQQDGLVAHASEQAVHGLEAQGLVRTAERNLVPRGERDAITNIQVFPNHPKFNWSRDDFGPLVVPARGMTIELDAKNLILYRRAIGTYEGRTIEVVDGQVHLDGEVATEYTFTMDYYWMMGDNRHASQDSRFWGFVPEDHVVGKAWFVVFSLNAKKSFVQIGQKVRWNRFFKGIHKNWAPSEARLTE